ncbi:MAG: hypothetical protein RR128_08825 [Clostridium sp.]
MKLSQKKVNMEFSKKLFIGVSLLNIVIVVFTLIMIWKTLDLSPLSYLIPSAFGELATATGFYYSKAKAENKIKLMKTEGVKPSPEDFNL